jgi:hypothetical protein
MKKSDLIPLNSNTTTVDADGEIIVKPETRSVAEEIERLRHMGAGGFAQLLENSCDDGKDDGSGYVEVDPTNVVIQTVGKRSVPVAFIAPARAPAPDLETESKP